MSQPRKKQDYIAIGIFSLLAGILFYRGISAVLTETYVSTTRQGSIINLSGLEAQLTGGGFIGLAGMIAGAIAYQYTPFKKPALYFGIILLIAALVSFGASFLNH